jgi:hypothetical protein
MVPVLDPGTENGNIGKLFKSKWSLLLKETNSC